MAVPNTTTFELQDVVDEINPTTDDLTDCFADANSDLFNSTYKSTYYAAAGNKNNLLMFRDYGGERELTFDISNVRTIYKQGPSWSTVHDAISGTIPFYQQPMKVWIEIDNGSYTINRCFFEVDLSDIPSAATILSATFKFRVDTEYGTDLRDYVAVVQGSQHDTVVDGDYDELDFTTKLFSGTITTSYDSGSNKLITIEASTSDLENLEDGFGDTIKMALAHSFDIGDAEPFSDTKDGYDIFLAGEVLTGWFGAPEVYIKYR